MAFPTTPTNGQTYTVNNLTYQYNSATNSWGRVVAAVYNKSVSSVNPPSAPNIGDLWYKTDTDITYRWTFDGTNYYWVDISGAATGTSVYPSDSLSPFLLMGA